MFELLMNLRALRKATIKVVLINQVQLEEIQRNALAYGYEIGLGKPMTETLDSSPFNPFLNKFWKRGVVPNVSVE